MPTVLVADDTASIRFLIRTNLELEGYDVLEAVDGVDCVERLAALHEAGTLPDVVTVDVMMPRQDGVVTAAQIRADRRYDGVKLVMVSTQNLAADIKRGYDAGVDAYVTKPFDPDEFIAVVARVLADTPEATGV